MTKLLRFLAICTISVAFAVVASAQTYTTIDFPGAIGTSLNGGPNPEGTSIGSYTDTFGVTHGFTLTAKGVMKSFDPAGSTLTSPNFISPQGVIVGSYLDSGNVSHGFILNGTKYTTVDAPGATGTTVSGLNPSGEISGFTCSDPACGAFGATNFTHSFVISKTGNFKFFDPPGAISSFPAVVIPSGAVVGSFTDNAGGNHGYILDHGKYTTIDFPGAIFTEVLGGNPEGDVVGLYLDTSFVGHGFLLKHGEFTSFDFPGAIFTDGTGINPPGIIVGEYFDSVAVQHGYVRRP